MKRQTHWLVADAGIDQNGDPDHCKGCHQPIGSEHVPGCHIRHRTVVVNIGFRIVTSVPEHYTEDQVNTALRSGDPDAGMCGDFLFAHVKRQLLVLASANRCLCGYAFGTYIREATQADEDEFLVRVNELSS